MTDPTHGISEFSAREIFKTIPIHFLNSGFYQYAPCQATPSRKGEGYCEIIFLQSGAAQIWLDDQQYEAHSGHIVVYLPETAHREVWQASNEPSVTYYVRFKGMFDAQDLSILHPILHAPVLNTGDYKWQFTQLFEMLSNEYRNQNTDCQLVCNILTENILLLTQRLLKSDSNTEKRASSVELSVAARQYIDTHYAENLTLQSIADALYVSVSRLAHVFHDAFGTSVIQYLNSVRIGQAKSFLQYTQMKIQDVGKQIGFDNPQTFNRIFKKLNGTTPSRFRNETNPTSVGCPRTPVQFESYGHTAQSKTQRDDGKIGI